MRILTKFPWCVLVGLGLAAMLATPARSCTTVCLPDKDKAVVAYNYDWYLPEGLVVVNKRGTKKISSLRTQAATWVATYGSVTFNQWGRDNPATGINEKSLMVSQMWLDETKYPPADARPELNGLGWVQYNLDRYASVAEVVANAEAVRPTSRTGLQHYLVADATGDAAVMEFLEGKLVVHRGEGMPVRALTNSTYADSVAAFERAKSKGEAPISSSSLDRFSRAAMLASKGNADLIARGFEILAAVAQTSTRWSIVYDLRAGEVYFRTEGNRAIRRFALADFDFSCATPVRMLDVTAGGAGDVGAAFVDYSVTANRALIEAAFTKTPAGREVPAAARDAIAAHPEKTSSCAAAN